jgi:hypothetical protein
MVGVWQGDKREGRMFFFEKKEPKNFCHLDYGTGRAYTPSDQSLLLLFFRKEGLSLRAGTDLTPAHLLLPKFWKARRLHGFSGWPRSV